MVSVAELNQTLFFRFNTLSRYGGELLWSHLTLLGDGLVVLVLVLPLVGRRPETVRAMTVAALLAMVWALGLKPLLGVPRPAAVLPAEALTVIGPVLKQYSFPSGHTTAIFTLAGVLALHAGSGALRWMLLLLAAVVGCSRMVVGVHWPLDVLGGAFGGWSAAVLGTLLAQRWPAGLRPPAQRRIAMLLVVAAAWLLLFHDSGDPGVALFQRFIAAFSFLMALPGLWGLARERYRISR